MKFVSDNNKDKNSSGKVNSNIEKKSFTKESLKTNKTTANTKMTKDTTKPQSQALQNPSNQTKILPKAKKTEKLSFKKTLENEAGGLMGKIFSSKYFVYDNSPSNFYLSIAVSSVKIMFLIFFFIMIALFGTLMGVASAYFETSPPVDSAALTDMSKTSLIYDASGNEISKYTGSENRVWVEIEEIPQVVTDAFISIEDTRFYSHEGIDYKRLIGAFVGNLQSSTVEGGSTISQQLVKISMLTSEKSYKRKIQEAYMTMIMESTYTKDQILESYLNTILLGGSNYGVQAAANDYFGKDISELTIRESAMLAGITQSPNKYNPRTNYHLNDTPEIVDDRTNLVIESMYSAGRITKEERDAALVEQVNVLATSNTNANKLTYAYFVEYAVEDITDHLLTQRGLENTNENRNAIENELRTSGYHIHLTIDTEIQNTVQDTLSEWENYPSTQDPDKAVKIETIGTQSVEYPQPEAAAVILDYQTGEYKAIVGGRNAPTAEKLRNRAENTNYGVGSSIKPITVYGPALDMGLSPSFSISNKTQAISGWNTSTGYPSGSGPNSMVTMREALVQSMNRASANLLMDEVGIETSAQYLRDMGVEEEHIYEDGSGLALGSSPIAPVEIVSAFGTIANSGEYIMPISFTKIVDGDGNVILDGKALQEDTKKQVYKESTAFILTDMLQEAVTRGTGTSARISGMNVAGKTGTNNDYRGISFSGYTPYYAASVFIGHDDYEPLRNAYAGSYAAPLWQEFMERIHEGLENKPIIEGDLSDYQLDEVAVCPVSGLLATDACYGDAQGNTPRMMLASDPDAPTSSCTAHQSMEICTASNKLPTDSCPAAERTTIVILNPTGNVTDAMAQEYMNVLKEMYPGLNIGMTCDIHASQTTVSPTEGGDINALKAEAITLLNGTYNFMITNKSNLSSDVYNDLLSSYNSLNLAYSNANTTASVLQSLINDVRTKRATAEASLSEGG